MPSAFPWLQHGGGTGFQDEEKGWGVGRWRGVLWDPSAEEEMGGGPESRRERKTPERKLQKAQSPGPSADPQTSQAELRVLQLLPLTHQAPFLGRGFTAGAP